MKNSQKRKLKKIKYEKRKQQKIARQIRKENKSKSTKIRGGFGNNNKGNESKSFYKSFEFLKNKGFDKNVDMDKSYVMIPKTFSFSRNPDETIGTLKNVFALGANPNTKEIFIDHSECSEMGIGASTILDIILLGIMKNNSDIDLKGIYSGDENSNNIRTMLEVSGLVKHLELKDIKEPNIKPLELITGGEAYKISEIVTDYFSSCLETQNYALTRLGKNRLSEMLGEVLNNCKQHCGEEVDGQGLWYTLGHYIIKKQNRGYGELHLVILNFGQTIFEGLKKNSKELAKKINLLTRKHMKRLIRDQNYVSKEGLWTLLALQDGVSRFRNGKRNINSDRGTGTIKLIDHFQNIGKTADGHEPLMSITSGKTTIIFDGTYKLENKVFGNNKYGVIAFNKENDINFPPDADKIKENSNYFPGTVITMQFYLDKKYIRRIQEEAI